MQLITKDQEGEVNNYELVSPFWKKPLKARKIKNEPAAIRADWIDQCADLVDRPFAQMAGLFHGLPTDYIKDLYLKAQETTGNKRAYFWSLYNKTKSK